MNQPINPWLAALIFSVFMAVLVGQYWANDQALDVQGYSYMHTHPDGTVYLQLNNQLFGLDAQGQLQQQIDLATLGVDPETPTDFGFFSNGDLLLRKSTSPRSFSENLQRFHRATNDTDVYGESDENALFRCQLQTEQCTRFGEKALNLNYAFAIAIDWRTDRVFISDAARHSIYLFSETGEELDRYRSRLKFPNQITYQDGELLIANTNHHGIAALVVNEDGFGDFIQLFSVFVREVEQNGQTWPASFLHLDDRTWVINSKHNMAAGGIYIFDQNGDFIEKAGLPDDADPYAIIQLGDKVLVNDFRKEVLYRYDLNGQRLDNFIAPKAMQVAAGIVREQRQYYRTIAQAFKIAFKTLVSLGFGIAVLQYLQRIKVQAFSIENVSIDGSGEGSDISWISANESFKKMLRYLWYFSLAAWVLIFLGLVVFSKSGYDFRMLLLYSGFYGLLTFLALWHLTKTTQLKMAVVEDVLILDLGNGEHVAAKPEHIYYSDRMVNIGDHFVAIGERQKIFSLADLSQHVYPLLRNANYLSASQMNLLFISKHKLPLALLLLATMGVWLF